MFYESEEFYRNLIAQVKDYAIFTTDPRGVITTWNEGCKNVLGYDRDEFIGQHIKMLFTPEAVASGSVDKEMEIAAEEGSASDDRWMMRKDGERFWASGITTGVRDEAGRPDRFHQGPTRPDRAQAIRRAVAREPVVFAHADRDPAAIGLDLPPRRRVRLSQSAVGALHRDSGVGATRLRLAQSTPSRRPGVGRSPPGTRR